jgi:hypothetical protein
MMASASLRRVESICFVLSETPPTGSASLGEESDRSVQKGVGEIAFQPRR